jgi:hypothetical protein
MRSMKTKKGKSDAEQKFDAAATVYAVHFLAFIKRDPKM